MGVVFMIIDFVGIDFVGIDFVRIDLMPPNLLTTSEAVFSSSPLEELSTVCRSNNNSLVIENYQLRFLQLPFFMCI